MRKVNLYPCTPPIEPVKGYRFYRGKWTCTRVQVGYRLGTGVQVGSDSAPRARAGNVPVCLPPTLQAYSATLPACLPLDKLFLSTPRYLDLDN